MMDVTVKVICENCHASETEDEYRGDRSRFLWINEFEMAHVACPEDEHPSGQGLIIIMSDGYATNGVIEASGGTGGAGSAGGGSS